MIECEYGHHSVKHWQDIQRRRHHIIGGLGMGDSKPFLRWTRATYNSDEKQDSELGMRIRGEQCAWCYESGWLGMQAILCTLVKLGVLK
jgi:hypothetical protein